MPSAQDPALIDRLAALLSDVTGADRSGLGEHSTPANTRGWESAANLDFIIAVEEEFGVTIATAEVLTLSSLGDVAAFLRARGPGRP